MEQQREFDNPAANTLELPPTQPQPGRSATDRTQTGQRDPARGGRWPLRFWQGRFRGRLLALSLRLWLVVMVAISLLMAFLANARQQRQTELSFIELIRQRSAHQVKLILASQDSGMRFY